MSMAMFFRSFKAFEPWTWFASLGFFAFLQQFIPLEYTDGLRRNLRLWVQSLTPYIFCDVREYEKSSLNTLYPDVEIYLSSIAAQAAHHLHLSKPKNANKMTFTMANGQRTRDQFDNAKVEWVHRVYERQRPMYTSGFQTHSDEKRSFTLQLWRKDKYILDKYMAHIQAQAKDLKRASRDLLLYTNSKGRDSFFGRVSPWESVNFVHPATFDTLALDGDMKTRICEDLDKFSEAEAYYRRVGKAWKRGYLLYGPPGTGKSSMIAAIANKMRYDVYDLELTEVESNIELRKLLLHTNNKSVIVIEDIDCSLDLSGQRKKKKKRSSSEPNPANPNPGKPQREQSKVTLSGLLNFVDGLWSSCGSERIFIFTTNYVEKLDPALLRAGRMDMHIHLSYCTFSAFKVLAKNYLQITDHDLFDELRKSFEGSYITPAEVSEVLIKNQDFSTVALENLLSSLDEHRVKPQPPPPDSDDEKDEKDVVKPAPPAPSKQDKEVTTTTTTDDATNITTTEIKEEKQDTQESLTGEKQISLEEKIHPIVEDPVKITAEISSTSKATENGKTESGTENGDSLFVAASPTLFANGTGAACSKDTFDAEVILHGAVHEHSNGEALSSRSADKKDGPLDRKVKGASSSFDRDQVSTNREVVTEYVGGGGGGGGGPIEETGDAAESPHSNESSGKVSKENGVVASRVDNCISNGDKSLPAAVTAVN